MKTEVGSVFNLLQFQLQTLKKFNQALSLFLLLETDCNFKHMIVLQTHDVLNFARCPWLVGGVTDAELHKDIWTLQDYLTV